MPCKCEITDDVASFVAMIMQGTKEKKIEFNLLFIPMQLTNLFGPHLMRSLFEFGMEIPVVLCTEKKLTRHKQQILDSAHLRITLNRDELESRTSGATRKPWTSYPLPWEKSKVGMLISSWWKPTLERLERHKKKSEETENKFIDENTYWVNDETNVVYNKFEQPIGNLKTNNNNDFELYKDMYIISNIIKIPDFKLYE